VYTPLTLLIPEDLLYAAVPSNQPRPHLRISTNDAGLRRRAQSRYPDAAADRGRNPQGALVDIFASAQPDPAHGEAVARGLAYRLVVAIILIAASPDSIAILLVAVATDPG
jgi:hypothetical protein